MTKVFANFYGGVNYSVGSLEDIEEFDSISEMLETFRNRRKGYDSFYPTVDNTASMTVWLERPRDFEDNPDRVYEFGPKGGVIRTY